MLVKFLHDGFQSPALKQHQKSKQAHSEGKKANFFKSINSLARKATNIFSVTLSILLPRTSRGIPFNEGLFSKSWSSN